MPGSHQDLEAARASAGLARSRLIGTMREIQQRLTPRALVEDMIEVVRERGGDLTQFATAKARAHPIATAGLVALIIAFVFRGSLGAVLARIFSRAHETDEGDDGSSGQETLYEAHPLWPGAQG